VEGAAIAGGTEILQACDIRVAGASARFGISEARWGLFPLGFGGPAAEADPVHGSADLPSCG
jgi:enoyl-CoA hydratase/carnithine racemase